MKNITLVFALIKVLIFSSLLLSLSVTTATAQSVSKQLFSELKTFSGQAIKRDNIKITHLVFIDLWRSYEGQGDEKMIAALPEQFLQQSQRIWLQPEINVTKAQLTEFQQYFPQVNPLVLDEKFSLMRALKIWQTPFHVLIRGNKQIFSGDAQALLTFIDKEYSLDINLAYASNHAPGNSKVVSQNEQAVVVAVEVVDKVSKAAKPKKPIVGDKAPTFSANTLAGELVSLSAALVKLSNNKPLNLVFIDALCPMPHFPNCEAKFGQLNELIKANDSRQWLGVVNSYYANEESAQQFAEKFSLKLPLLFDHDNSIFKTYQVYASPYQIKVNRNGLIESRSDLLN